MKYEERQNIATGSNEFYLEIPRHLIVELQLNKLDNLLLQECAGSEKISDKLLALETIARRIEERDPVERIISEEIKT